MFVGVSTFTPEDVQQAFDFARQLERELNTASKQRDDALMMLGIYRMTSDEQRVRIKKLEEAGDGFTSYCTPETIDAHFEELIENWRKAKEAKPCRYCLRSNCECSDSDIMPDIGDK